MAGQCAVVNLVGAGVKRLKRLRVQKAYQKIKRVVVIRYDRVQRAFLFAQRVQVHIVMVGNRLNLRKVKGRKPYSRGHEYAFRCFASG